VKFLVDENLSPRLCCYLADAEDSAEHVRDALGAGTSDDHVLDHARERGQVIVTADTDFGALIARSGARRPSVILVRELLGLTVSDQGSLLAANLEQIRDVLSNGAVVVLGLDGIRVRPLPIT
jgi:predicted nuclease of predicted toxin-antitoxin system